MIVVDRRWQAMASQIKAAQVFGRLIAQGMLEPAECYHALQDAAAKSAPSANPGGRQMVISHALRDSIAEWSMTRDRARRAIRKALDPLLERRAPSAEMLEAGEIANEDRGDPLLPREVREAVAECVTWHLRQLERDARQQAGARA